jgi:tetratricopeptide (TPR) repeat protein
LNDRAWMLAADPDPEKRDPVRAVKLAKEAVTMAAKSADYWNTLGLAQYRTGNWNEAISSLQKYRELRTGDAEWNNPFFLAMAHWRLGNKDEARRWYDIAVKWMHRPARKTEPLLRFQNEAAELLGVNVKTQSDPPSAPTR